MHRVSNVALGEVMKRHVTRIFFPRYQQTADDTLAISQEHLAFIYDEGVLPAIRHCTPSLVSRWPASYAVALKNAKDRKGQLHCGTIDLSVDELSNFAIYLRENLRAEPCLRDAYFGHELRGTKGVTDHDPYDDDEQQVALDKLFTYVDRDQIDLNDWHVDLGLEVYHPGHALFWITSGHSRLLKFCLPSLSDVAIDRLRNSSRFLLDRAMQLTDLSGFRLEPGSKGDDDNVRYMNVYSTEKIQTYQLHQGIWRRHWPNELFPKVIDELLDVINEKSLVCPFLFHNLTFN